MAFLQTWINPAFKMHLSRSLPEAQKQSRLLYRRCLKSCPEIKKIYQVPVSVDDMRKKLRAEWGRHSHITDAEMIDTIVLKGFNDLEEAVGNFTFRANIWSFFEHILLETGPKETLEEKEEREALEQFANPDVHRSLPRYEDFAMKS